MNAPNVPTALPNVPIYASTSEGSILCDEHEFSIIALELSHLATPNPCASSKNNNALYLFYCITAVYY